MHVHHAVTWIDSDDFGEKKVMIVVHVDMSDRLVRVLGVMSYELVLV